MADAEMAVAKIPLAAPRSGLAAAISGLAAAIMAVAVIGPSSATRPPSTTTVDRSVTGPAATAAGWPQGPVTTWPQPAGRPEGASTVSPERPSTGSQGDRPATQPAAKSTSHPSGPEPLSLTRGQLLAAPPTGRDLGPLAAPAALSGCLARFGSTPQPVAARQVVLDGRAGILLVLPTEMPGRLRLLVVDPRCSAAIADDIVGR
jgi:hypothetical protein